MLKRQIISISFLTSILLGQSSIEIPAGASLTIPKDAYICVGTLTVNGTINYDASSLCVQPNAHLIASIIKSSALNENGYYKVGDTISVTLTFSQNVFVTGVPQLTLETGDIDHIVDYTSGDQTLTLTFNYIVQLGNVSPDLEYISTSALSLNGGSIRNAYDKDADLLLPEPGTQNSLSSNKDLYVDGIIPVSGIVNDGLNEDLQYTNSLTELSFNWSDFDDPNSSGINRYFIGLGSTPGGIELKSFEDVGNNTNHTYTSLDLTNGGTYYGVVKAEDKAGNVSIKSVSDGITIDEFDGPPAIEVITPDVVNTLTLNDVSMISIDFTEPISSLSLDITSNINTVDYSYDLNAKNLAITILSSLASRDELSIEINDLTDFAGITATDQTIIYSTATLADLNEDNNVNAVDLSLFAEAWNANDFTKELGPATGTVPNLILSPDSKYDLEDVMGFSRMWHWSRKNGVSGKQLAQFGEKIIYSQVESTIIIDWDKNASVAQFDFIYDPQFIRIKNSDHINDENMELSYFDTLNGQNVFAYANLSDEKYINKKYSTEVIGKESHSIDLSYQFFTDRGQLISQGTESILIKPIPLEFALHQNYPNPFNPITTINYDLPQQSHVNIMIYDILGREVAKLVNSEISAGYQSVIWNTRNNLGAPVSAGIYFYQIQTKDFVKTKKMVLLK